MIFEPNVIDMMADREIIKSVSISAELKTIYEIFLNYLKGPECCQKNAEETRNRNNHLSRIYRSFIEGELDQGCLSWGL